MLTGVAVFQCREKDCNQVLSVMHQGRQEGERLRPVRSLNDDDSKGTGSLEAHKQTGEGHRVGRAGRQEGHKRTLEPGPMDAAFPAGVHLSRLRQGRGRDPSDLNWQVGKKPGANSRILEETGRARHPLRRAVGEALSEGELANSVEAASGYTARSVLEQLDKFTPPHNLVEDEGVARSVDHRVRRRSTSTIIKSQGFHADTGVSTASRRNQGGRLMIHGILSSILVFHDRHC